MYIPDSYIHQKNNQTRIAHLTSVHPRFDTRIFLKQCNSLAQNGYETFLVVADSKGHEEKNNVRILDVGGPKNRMNRMLRVTNRVYRAAIALDADIYHLHDPELIPIGMRLKRRGKKVIFDSHEDVPLQMLNKPYLTPFLLRIIASLYALYEDYACKRLDGIITATPCIREKFAQINHNTLDVNNYPLLGELDSKCSWNAKKMEVCYVGGISSVRGILETVEAMSEVESDVRLNLAGAFLESSLRENVLTTKGWERVNELGFLQRTHVRNILSQSRAGLVTLWPIPNYIESLPVKMFEYMLAGIPVIASHFPLWKEIIEGAQCGICVDPKMPKQIAAAIDRIIKHPEEAKTMGDNGRKAIYEKYNWAAEEKKLLGFYDALKEQR